MVYTHNDLYIEPKSWNNRKRSKIQSLKQLKLEAIYNLTSFTSLINGLFVLILKVNFSIKIWFRINYHIKVKRDFIIYWNKWEREYELINKL